MPELEHSNTTTESGAKGRYFVRFTREQRYMHAVLFTTFLGLAATGLPSCASARASGRASSPPAWADSAPSSSSTSSAPSCSPSPF